MDPRCRIGIIVFEVNASTDRARAASQCRCSDRTGTVPWLVPLIYGRLWHPALYGFGFYDFEPAQVRRLPVIKFHSSVNDSAIG